MLSSQAALACNGPTDCPMPTHECCDASDAMRAMGNLCWAGCQVPLVTITAATKPDFDGKFLIIIPDHVQLVAWTDTPVLPPPRPFVI